MRVDLLRLPLDRNEKTKRRSQAGEELELARDGSFDLIEMEDGRWFERFEVDRAFVSSACGGGEASCSK